MLISLRALFIRMLSIHDSLGGRLFIALQDSTFTETSLNHSDKYGHQSGLYTKLARLLFYTQYFTVSPFGELDLLRAKRFEYKLAHIWRILNETCQ